MLVRDSLNVAEDSYYKEVLHYMGQGINGMGRRPRTALGITRSQRRMVVIVCNGDKVQSSAGITLPELGDLFLRFGCVMAVNLDGGGSSAFVGREGTPAERHFCGADPCRQRWFSPRKSDSTHLKLRDKRT